MPLPRGAVFCPECGAVVKRKDGKAASLIKALLCGAGYIAIQYVCALLFFLLLGVTLAVIGDESAAELFTDIASIVSGAVVLVCQKSNEGAFNARVSAAAFAAVRSARSHLAVCAVVYDFACAVAA